MREPTINQIIVAAKALHAAAWPDDPWETTDIVLCFRWIERAYTALCAAQTVR
jgi:hypothetical protein